MHKELIITLAFVVILNVFAFVWSQVELNKYRKMNRTPDAAVYSISCFTDTSINLVGVGEDENNEVKVAETIGRLNLPETLKIEPYNNEEE